MMLTKQQAEVLLRYMIEAAKAIPVLDSINYPNCAKQVEQVFLARAETLAHEINELQE